MWVAIGEYADLSVYDVVDEILDMVNPKVGMMEKSVACCFMPYDLCMTLCNSICCMVKVGIVCSVMIGNLRIKVCGFCCNGVWCVAVLGRAAGLSMWSHHHKRPLLFYSMPNLFLLWHVRYTFVTPLAQENAYIIHHSSKVYPCSRLLLATYLFCTLSRAPTQSCLWYIVRVKNCALAYLELESSSHCPAHASLKVFCLFCSINASSQVQRITYPSVFFKPKFYFWDLVIDTIAHALFCFNYRCDRILACMCSSEIVCDNYTNFRRREFPEQIFEEKSLLHPIHCCFGDLLRKNFTCAKPPAWIPFLNKLDPHMSAIVPCHIHLQHHIRTIFLMESNLLFTKQSLANMLSRNEFWRPINSLTMVCICVRMIL